MASLASFAHFGTSTAAGPMLVAYILNFVFFGVLSIQFYLYHLAFNDGPYIKAIVYVTYTLECVQIVLFTYSGLNTYVIQLGGSLEVLDEVGTLWLSVPVISGLLGYIAQSLYAYRLYKFTAKKYVTAVVVTFSLFQLGMAFAIAFEAKREGLFSRLFDTRALLVTSVWGGGSAICDVLIAVCMIYYLTRWDLKLMKNTITHDVVWKFVRLTIETGSLTAIIAILAVILISLPGRPPYYQTCIGIIGKAYSNSVLVILNSRLTISSPFSACQSEEQLPERECAEGLVFAPVAKDNDTSGTFTTMDASRSTAA